MAPHWRAALFVFVILVVVPVLSGVGMLVDSWVLAYVAPGVLTAASAWYAKAGDKPGAVAEDPGAREVPPEDPVPPAKAPPGRRSRSGGHGPQDGARTKRVSGGRAR